MEIPHQEDIVDYTQSQPPIDCWYEWYQSCREAKHNHQKKKGILNHNKQPLILHNLLDSSRKRSVSLFFFCWKEGKSFALYILIEQGDQFHIPLWSPDITKFRKSMMCFGSYQPGMAYFHDYGSITVGLWIPGGKQCQNFLMEINHAIGKTAKL